ncbi:MAG: aspartate--tRNA ligase, partial [Planctomycetota bacterium]|nr:aspartate--tRNA ligase [Planctomycetota bacterium]
MATGAIELRATQVEVLSRSKLPPFEIVENIDTSVEQRLKYRYLDLRRPDMLHKLEHRSRFIGAMRNAFLKQGFLDIETPILTKATPEGARDYLVPSRVHPGKWYALPQSPQIFKQLLQISGTDRYFQVARCFRDEDLRADRQPEFTQLDMEMSFVEEEDVWSVWEEAMVDTFREAMDVELSTPFPRMTWAEAMERYGLDKPDTRFGMELTCLAEWVPQSGFGVFQAALAAGDRVMAIAAPGGGKAISRGQVKKLEELARSFGAQGLAWWKPGETGGGAGPMARFCEGDAGTALCARLGAGEDDLVLFCAGDQEQVWRVLGELRNHLGKSMDLIPEGRWDFLWVTHFPMFEKVVDEETGAEGWTSSHHPFTAPQDWDLAGDPGDMTSRAYDLVLNGWELGSGSIRIHRQETQTRVFELLGIGAQEQEQKFGFLLGALAYGAPPHGGFAVGLDRLVALSLRMDSIRDVVAFPKTATAADAMCEAPSVIEAALLREVHVAQAAVVNPTETQ